MNRTEVRKTLDRIAIEVDAIADPHIAATQKMLLNLVEVLFDANAVLHEENRKLKDEINRLKGEKGQPGFRAQKSGDSNTNHSSENDRKNRGGKPPRKSKMKKSHMVKIDRRVDCEMDPSILPLDAVFKGYETRIFQDIKIGTDNVEFSLPVYYSPSLNKTFMAPLPSGYYGEFGPGVRSLIITLYRDSGMTQPAIARFLKIFAIHISGSTISNMITENHDVFHAEKEAIVTAGLKANLYQHLDDTGSRVNGKNHYTHILCNPYFTAFFTRPHKDRLTLLDILCRDNLQFELSDESYTMMTELGLSEKQLTELKKIAPKKLIVKSEMKGILQQLFPNPHKHIGSRNIIREAAGLVYYRKSEYAIKHLICDDAKQFNKIAEYKSLCWVHEGRHYKKLNPLIMMHRNILDNFINDFWDYYDELLGYRANPSEKLATELSTKFDILFSKKTGYDALDERIVSTFIKKESLLLVLTFPFLELHNNSAELGARVQARMRDINLQTISVNGTKSKDTFATIVQTAKKIGVNIYDFIYDRVSKTFEMPSLADVIIEKSALANSQP
ncbi:MAG TPA: hypothetical protein VJL60_04915 [Gammaproteobacteria bacterium]|nr:hypothetical protein [Gammaproteobacteria bacterium]